MNKDLLPRSCTPPRAKEKKGQEGIGKGAGMMEGNGMEAGMMEVKEVVYPPSQI